jgi:single-strand DNA-binding protein
LSDLNSVFLIGRLTRDADLKYTAGRTAVSKFSIAVNERRKSDDQWKETAGFFDVILWGQLGESLSRYLTKGKQIAVTGRLTQERWEQDGQNRSRVVVTASMVQLLGGSSGSGDSGQADRPSAPPPDKGGFADDIPF